MWPSSADINEQIPGANRVGGEGGLYGEAPPQIRCLSTVAVSGGIKARENYHFSIFKARRNTPCEMHNN